MRLLLCTFAAAALVGPAAVFAATSPKIAFTGDVALITTLKLDNGSTGAPGYQRAKWTTSAPVHAVLTVTNAKGVVVERMVGGNPDSLNAALIWMLSSGKLSMSHVAPKPGHYVVRLTLTAFVKGMSTQLTDDSVVASWSAVVK